MDTNPPVPVPSPPAPPLGSPVSIWFRLAGLFGGLFCLTAVAWAAAGVGDQSHPLKAWLGRHGTGLIVFESVAVLVTTLLGMFLPDKAAVLPGGDRPRGERRTFSRDPSDTSG